MFPLTGRCAPSLRLWGSVSDAKIRAMIDFAEQRIRNDVLVALQATVSAGAAGTAAAVAPLIRRLDEMQKEIDKLKEGATPKLSG